MSFMNVFIYSYATILSKYNKFSITNDNVYLWVFYGTSKIFDKLFTEHETELKSMSSVLFCYFLKRVLFVCLLITSHKTSMSRITREQDSNGINKRI